VWHKPTVGGGGFVIIWFDKVAHKPSPFFLIALAKPVINVKDPVLKLWDQVARERLSKNA
jgi:hypothetical protein